MNELDLQAPLQRRLDLPFHAPSSKSAAMTCRPPIPPPQHQRSSGVADIAVKRRGERTVIDRCYQQGSVNARLPRGTPTEAVLINMAGGLTGSDKLTWQV